MICDQSRTRLPLQNGMYMLNRAAFVTMESYCCGMGEILQPTCSSNTPMMLCREAMFFT